VRRFIEIINMETSTPKGTEGFGISFSDELRCAEALQPILPKGWKVRFQWLQILFNDVRYSIDKEAKTIDITYNQNLGHWQKPLVEEIASKLKQLAVA